MRQIALLLVLGSTLLQAQSVTPFVDHWDSTRTVKKSEGLLVNGREWGEWTFWDPQGRKTEVAEFEAGHWEEARVLLQRLYNARPSGESLRLLGAASYELRDYAIAR